eukprot:SAG31_NODE_4450_length_3221_cov_2.819987_2_plen_92_part_00
MLDHIVSKMGKRATYLVMVTTLMMIRLINCHVVMLGQIKLANTTFGTTSSSRGKMPNKITRCGCVVALPLITCHIGKSLQGMPILTISNTT